MMDDELLNNFIAPINEILRCFVEGILQLL